MKDRELKGKLQQLHIPKYDEHKLEEVISEVKNIDFFPENQRMTNTEFFFNQVGFISKKVWGLKIIFSLFILYLFIAEDININNWMWTLLAIAGPILCLFNAKEICNVFQPGMFEIQMATKHSFSKVLMIRLIVFGIFDLLFLICSTIILSLVKETVIWQIILYGTVPYVIMCFGCMYILNKCHEENILLYSTTWGICLSSRHCYIENIRSGIICDMLFCYLVSIWSNCS
ncbi:MAG: hypothetical protein ACLUBO_10410 [Coprococcus sp.]